MGRVAFQAHFVGKRLSKSIEGMKLLPQLRDLQIALLLLQKTFLPRVRFLLAAVPGWSLSPPIAAEFAAWDACVWSVLRQLLRQEPPRRITWPRADGGLDMSEATPMHAAIFIGGQVRAARVVHAFLPRFAPLLTDPSGPFALRVLSARAQLPPAAAAALPGFAELFTQTDSEARNSSKAVATAARDALVARDRAQLSLLERRVALLSATPGAGAGFTRRPTFAKDRLADGEMRTATCIFLGVRPPAVRHFSVGDPLGRTVLSASTAARTATHDSVLHALADVARDAGRSVRTEVLGLYGPYPGQLATASKRGEQRRMDILSVVPATGERALVDVTRPDCATPPRARAPDALKPLRDAELKKLNKYGPDCPPGYKYHTFAIGPNGELGGEADAHLQQLAREGAQLRSGGDVPTASKMASVRWGYLQRIQIALMRGQARQYEEYVLTELHHVAARGERLCFGAGNPDSAVRRWAVGPILEVRRITSGGGRGGRGGRGGCGGRGGRGGAARR
jgi:hypothetical protein